jgi:alpha-tubulin suppressor-like RCC1 family protein
MAIKTDGTLWAWGSNSAGRLGDNTDVNKSSPIQVGALTTWSVISNSGGSHSMALKTDGTMWAWGANGQGQLGDNTQGVTRSSPIQIGSLTTWSKIACGKYHSMAIKTDGTMWLWGTNYQGSIGNNDSELLYRSSPVQIGTFTWSLIANGSYQSMAIRTDGTLWLWGMGSYGRLGNNTTINRSSPVQVGALTTWSKIAAGTNHCMAIKTDGTMWMWGNGDSGRMGDSTTVNKSSPIQVGALTSWRLIAAGENHSLAIALD